jgi:hypothetical protein
MTDKEKIAHLMKYHYGWGLPGNPLNLDSHHERCHQELEKDKRVGKIPGGPTFSRSSS